MLELILGILLPFAGTALGAAMVFFMKNSLDTKLEKLLLGFAGGVMFAAAIWSLIIPALNKSANMQALAFLPTLIGFLLGFAFLFIMDICIPTSSQVPQKNNSKTKRMIMAITLHNIPEGLAMGVALAGVYYGELGLTIMSTLALSLGIAIQNFPEGAIVSLPLRRGGVSRTRSFMCGVLSGIVEPISAIVAFLLTGIISSLLPYILAFAGGAMIYVVIDELIPEASQGEYSNLATIGFMVGFALMMALDTALG